MLLPVLYTMRRNCVDIVWRILNETCCASYMFTTQVVLYMDQPRINPTDGDEYMRIRRLILSQTIFTDMGSYSLGTR